MGQCNCYLYFCVQLVQKLANVIGCIISREARVQGIFKAFIMANQLLPTCTVVIFTSVFSLSKSSQMISDVFSLVFASRRLYLAPILSILTTSGGAKMSSACYVISA